MAGEAFVRVQPFLDMPLLFLDQLKQAQKRVSEVRVMGMVNPHLDVKKAAQALIDMARERLDHNM